MLIKCCRACVVVIGPDAVPRDGLPDPSIACSCVVWGRGIIYSYGLLCLCRILWTKVDFTSVYFSEGLNSLGKDVLDVLSPCKSIWLMIWFWFSSLPSSVYCLCFSLILISNRRFGLGEIGNASPAAV